MKADKKIIIKVKSKTEQRIMADPKVEMITAWNIKRIAYAVLGVLIVIIMFVYYFKRDEANKNNQSVVMPVYTEKQKSAVPATRIAVKVEKTVPRKIIQPEVSNKIPEIKTANISKIASYLRKELIEPEMLNPHVPRAKLVKGVSDLEPYGEVDLPIIINNSEAQGVFYFTDIIKMKGSIVFHEWLKQEKSIYKRKFIIRGNRWRVSTSKLFDINSSGDWQVKLITQSGEVLNKIKFSVKK